MHINIEDINFEKWAHGLTTDTTGFKQGICQPEVGIVFQLSDVSVLMAKKTCVGINVEIIIPQIKLIIGQSIWKAYYYVNYIDHHMWVNGVYQGTDNL